MNTTLDLPPLIGASPPFLALLEQVSLLAPLDRPVLVIGERGTGKELIAARLHLLSRRWGGPFWKLNCAALPESLIEGELFGHEAGAFTGATRRRVGRFELADGGSFFLDEVANASASVQEKLLRVIEYGEFDRLGGDRTVRVDVRLIAATNVDLPAAADAGRFRHDLLDRLAFDVLTVPPLRARPDDIPLLAQQFARDFSVDLGRDGFAGFTDGATAALAGHGWPGNVRELKNAVERAVYRTEPGRPVAEIQLDPFDSPYRTGTAPRAAAGDDAGDLIGQVNALEKRLIVQAMAAARHNQRAAARALGLSYDQLRHRLRKHALG